MAGEAVREVSTRPLPERLEAYRLAEKLAAPAGPPGVVRFTLDEIRNPPCEEFLLGSLFPLAKASLFFGPTSTGKSVALSQVAFAIAAGAERLWGLPLLRGGGPVLIYSAEDSLDDWRRKGAAALADGQIDMERAIGNLFIIDKSEGLARLSEVVTIRSGEVEIVTRKEARPTAEQDFLIEAANHVGAKALFAETTSRLVDDEDNASFSALQSACGRVARMTGAAVILTHHATKQASRDNEPTIEAARGGGALTANARTAVALFAAEEEVVKTYAGRFASSDLFQLWHLKPSSSTRKQAPITLVRCDAIFGAAFRLPDDVAFSEEQQQANAARVDAEREAEWDQLRKLYAVVERTLPIRPSLSPSRLRENAQEIGVGKNRVESLVQTAVDRGVLRVRTRNERGITVGLGFDPRKAIADAIEERANAGESSKEVLP